MIRWICVFVSFSCLASQIEDLEKESLLYRSAKWSERYGQEIAKKTAPGSSTPQTGQCLSTASVWFTVDLALLGAHPLDELSQKELWDLLSEIGVQAVDCGSLEHGVRQANAEQDWSTIVDLAGTRQMVLIGHPLLPLMSSGPDFQLAIRAYKNYSQLFHLIEIARSDWGLLPKVTPEQISLPVPMVTVEALKKLGYLEGKPDKVYPYAPTSCWEATSSALGVDNQLRRWIFLRNQETGGPLLNWLGPTFTSQELAGGELTNALLRLEQTIAVFDASPTENALSTMASLTRKLGGYSALRIQAPLAVCKRQKADLIYDSFTGQAFLHALITEDGTALASIYREFLKEDLQPKSLVHELIPYSKAPCEWTAFLQNSKPKKRTSEEEATDKLLQERLLQEDRDRLHRSPSTYTPQIAPLYGLCDPLQNEDLACRKAQLLEGQLLLAFFYAMQPGAFSFSAVDLRGALSGDPMKGCGLYSPLSSQMKQKRSFARELKAMLDVRGVQEIAQAELINVLSSKDPGLILLLHRNPSTGFFFLTAVNVSKKKIREELQGSFLINRWPIDLMKGQVASKLFASDVFALEIEALSGKVFLFQPKYYPDWK